MPIIENAAGSLVDAYRQRLQKRIAELIARGGQSIELDEGRLAQEVAYLADRSDISEELVRLRSHLEQFRGALKALPARADLTMPISEKLIVEHYSR